MEFLGVVAEIGFKWVVVRGGPLPEAGDPVFDSRKKRIGTVKRVFGPVDSPFVSVTLAGGCETALGAEMYYSKESKHGKSKRRS